MAPWIPLWKLLGFGLYMALYLVVCEATWDYPAETLKTVAFKALPIVHLLFIILSTDIYARDYGSYKWNIVLGLLFSMAGDACMVWRVTLFLPGLLFFSITHVLYARAFRMTPFGGGPTVASCLILLGSSFLILAPGVLQKEGPLMYLLVFSYSSLIFTMFWRSVVSFQTWPSRGTFCGCLGASLFAVSDFLIALDKWHHEVAGGALYIMLTYFFAQMLIAISAACYTTRAPVKED